MATQHEITGYGVIERTSAAIDGLRTTLVIWVVAMHSFLAYLSFLPPRTYSFDTAPWAWRSYPIVDSTRVAGLDIFCAAADTFVMASFFFVSGLFVWQGLSRKGAVRFARERLLRLGVPFAAAVLTLIPVALVPVYLVSAVHPGIGDFLSHWFALPFWPTGPLWFLWLLLALDLAAACFPRREWTIIARLSAFSAQNTRSFLAILLTCSIIAYVPLALAFGPMRWFQEGPFSFQLSRPGLYAVYFFAGIVIGAGGIERSLIAADGAMARRWKHWLAAAIPAFALWLAVTAMVVLAHSTASFAWQAADAVCYALTCFASCFCALAIAARFGRPALSWWRSLQRNAYGIYLLHYLFVIWLQFALLFAPLPGAIKAALVLAGTLAMSWLGAAGFRRARSAVAALLAQRSEPVAAAMARPNIHR